MCSAPVRESGSRGSLDEKHLECTALQSPLELATLNLQVANDSKQHGKDTGIAGGAIMGEILTCPSTPHIEEIHVTLLDCPDVVRRRGTHGLTQDILSWAAWQRVHIDPQWRQDVICGRQLETMWWERWMSWQRGDPRWRVHVLDTTNLRLIRWSTKSLPGFWRAITAIHS